MKLFYYWIFLKIVAVYIVYKIGLNIKDIVLIIYWWQVTTTVKIVLWLMENLSQVEVPEQHLNLHLFWWNCCLEKRNAILSFRRCCWSCELGWFWWPFEFFFKSCYSSLLCKVFNVCMILNSSDLLQWHPGAFELN